MERYNPQQPTSDSRNHVWVSSEHRMFHLRLARAIDARVLTSEATARPMSFKEVTLLLLIHHGHIPPRDEPTTERRLAALRAILGERDVHAQPIRMEA